MATTPKYYAQKDALGFPIPGTMMSGAVVPKAANIIEISLDSNITSFEKPHPKGLRYFVSVDKDGKIIPNSLVSAFSAPDRVELGVGTLSSSCIQFVVNTTVDTYFEFTATSLTQEFTYTVEWGDGETGEGSSGEGGANFNHTYPDSNTEYTVRVCFSDASVIHLLNFPGFD